MRGVSADIMCKGEERESQSGRLEIFFTDLTEREREQQEFRSEPGKAGSGF